MIQIGIGSNIDSIAKQLTIDAKQIPFAVSRALNRAMFDAKATVEQVMASTLDRPTAYTVRSLRVLRSDKTRLEAKLDYKNTPGGQRPAEAWMSTQIEGGARRPKALERLLWSRGAIPAGAYLVPTSNAKTDANGNWARSQVRAVALELNVAIDKTAQKRLAASAARRAAGTTRVRASRYVVLPGETNGLPAGIYERVKSAFGDGMKPLALIETGAPRYKKRVPFYQVAERVAIKKFNEYLPQELENAMKTAKK